MVLIAAAQHRANLISLVHRKEFDAGSAQIAIGQVDIEALTGLVRKAGDALVGELRAAIVDVAMHGPRNSSSRAFERPVSPDLDVHHTKAAANEWINPRGRQNVEQDVCHPGPRIDRAFG